MRELLTRYARHGFVGKNPPIDPRDRRCAAFLKLDALMPDYCAKQTPDVQAEKMRLLDEFTGSMRQCSRLREKLRRLPKKPQDAVHVGPEFVDDYRYAEVVEEVRCVEWRLYPDRVDADVMLACEVGFANKAFFGIDAEPVIYLSGSD
jgi:hypothetical protein